MVDLPQPVLPSTATISPVRDVEQQPVDREEVAATVGAAEHLADVAKLDDRVAPSRSHIARSETAR